MAAYFAGRLVALGDYVAMEPEPIPADSPPLATGLT